MKTAIAEAEMVWLYRERLERVARRQSLQRGTSTAITKHPCGSRWAATLRKHATCPSCVVRFMIVFATS